MATPAAKELLERIRELELERPVVLIASATLKELTVGPFVDNAAWKRVRARVGEHPADGQEDHDGPKDS
jgi:hypothetical protein